MTLTKCPDCGKEVSDSAPTCPGCGRPFAPPTKVVVVQEKQRTSCLAWGCLGFILIGILGAIMSSLIVGPTVTKQPTLPSAPTPASGPELTTSPEIDVKIRACKKGGFGVVALWDLTLKNKSKKWAYADLRYRANYEAESGANMRTSRGTIAIVLKPGEVRNLNEFNDGIWPDQATRCGFVIIAADERRP